MPVSFSTLGPMNPATISKMPTYTKAAAQAPVASTSLEPKDAKKNSHWFLKTLATVAVLTAGVALLRSKVDVFKNFDKALPLADGAKFLDKAKHYGLKAVAVAGDFVIDNANKAIAWGKNLFNNNKPTGGATA